jgi:hypothetical protein
MKGVVALLLIAGAASGSVVGYHIDPVKAIWSGWTHLHGPGDTVAQQVVVCWDSLDRVELFAGAVGDSGAYTATVYEGGMRLMSSPGDGVPDHGWVKFDQWDDTVAFTKGKTVTIRFTRGGSDSIEYYFDGSDPYCGYGEMIVGQSIPFPNPNDLACRVFGRLDIVDSLDFGACEVEWWGSVPDFTKLAGWTDSANVGTVRLDIDWHMIQYNNADEWNFALTDSSLQCLHNIAGCRVVGLLTQVPNWASTRRDYDSVRNESICYRCPPRRLQCRVGSDSNYLAAFLRGFIAHCDSRNETIHDWEVLNEVNTGDSLPPGPGTTSWWRHPNFYYVGDSIGVNVSPGLHDMCSLYVRYAVVVESAIHAIPGHEADRIIVNSLNHVNYADHVNPSGPVYSGKEWLQQFYDIANRDTIHGRFWSAISAHPYLENANHPFSPCSLEAIAETLRNVMHANGDYGELWNTEFSMPGIAWWGGGETLKTPEQEADICCATFTAAQGMKSLPGGHFDQNYWWLLRSGTTEALCGYQGDSARAPLWSFKQTAERLVDTRCNGRVVAGDNSVRVYEFENPATSRKTWVCWKDHGGAELTTVNLPVRADSDSLEILDYGEHAQPALRQPNSGTGWLTIGGVSGRPQFVTEPANESISRPELAVDSFRAHPLPLRVGEQSAFEVYVKNNGDKDTPGQVQVNIYWNDSLLTTIVGDTIPAHEGRWASVVGGIIPAWVRGTGLLKAEANPGQQYVEQDGTDDNCGYIRTTSYRRPIGDIGVVTGSHSNEPLPLLGLESRSYESDTLGSAPAESARLIQWVYGNDTIVDGGDTTEWFCVNQAVSLDTTWAYLSGQSKYRFFIQVKDSWSESELIPDTVHPYVVLDTTAPTGSIVINSGARFAASSTCTLRLSAQDSLSSVAGMRLLNVPPANLVSYGGFVGNGGAWDYVNGGYDESLGLGWLTAASAQATVSQFIPAESISAHAGDSCVLEASIMAHVHEDDAVGSASFWYLSTNVNPQITDTLWQLVDSAGFSGNLLSLTGRYALSKHFLLTTPAPDTNWVWQGGIVRVEASAENGNGTVYVDNAALIPYEAGSGNAWWANYDTLVGWTIESGAGPHVVRATFIDSAGNWNAPPYADTVILDPTPPVVDIGLPMMGQLVNGSSVEVTGWAYDPIEMTGDTWLSRRTLSFRHADSTNWLPVNPDSTSLDPAYPDSMASQGPAVHLGYWNTLGLDDGTYYLLLTASDSAGNTSSCTTWVMVDQGFGGGGMRSGPEGGGSGMGEGSVFVGSATGTVLHLGDDLDSLDAFSVSDSGSRANITSVLEVGEDSILVLDAHNRRVHKLHRSGQHRRRLVSGLSQPVDLKRDSSGNFWLVDRGWNRIGKFRSNGTLVFVRGGLGADSIHFRSPEGIAVKGGLVYVAGAVDSLGFAVVSLRPDGTERWTSGLERAGGAAVSLAFFDDGSVVAAGAYSVGGACVVRYDADGNRLWTWQRPYGHTWTYVMEAIAADNRGNAYFAGYTSDSFTVAGLSKDGQQQWLHMYGSGSSGVDGGQAIAVTPNGRVCCVGSADGVATTAYEFDGDGTLLWSHSLGTLWGKSCVGGLAVAPDGNILIAGTSAGFLSDGDFVVTCLAPETGD